MYSNYEVLIDYNSFNYANLKLPVHVILFMALVIRVPAIDWNLVLDLILI